MAGLRTFLLILDFFFDLLAEFGVRRLAFRARHFGSRVVE